MNPSRPSSTAPLLALAATLLVAVSLLAPAGCSKNPAAPKPAAAAPAAPVPNSPAAAIQALGWDLTHLDWPHYSQLLPDDYSFAFSATDPAGTLYADRTMYRNDELTSLNHILVSGFGTLPAAKSVAVVLGVIQPVPDSRQGKTYPWHQEVSTSIQITVDNGPNQYYVVGSVRFFLVRGDSALIPADLVAQGFHPDASRWWIERWEDGTGTTANTSPGSGALPTLKATWGSVKMQYLTGSAAPAP